MCTFAKNVVANWELASSPFADSASHRYVRDISKARLALFRKTRPCHGKSERCQKYKAFIQEFRKHALVLGISVLLSTLAFYFYSPQLFTVIQSHLDQKLVFYTVAEPFLAHLKLALAFSLFFLIPGIAFSVWKALSKPFKLTNISFCWFVSFTCLLFSRYDF